MIPKVLNSPESEEQICATAPFGRALIWLAATIFSSGPRCYEVSNFHVATCTGTTASLESLMEVAHSLRSRKCLHWLRPSAAQALGKFGTVRDEPWTQEGAKKCPDSPRRLLGSIRGRFSTGSLGRNKDRRRFRMSRRRAGGASEVIGVSGLRGELFFAGSRGPIRLSADFLKRNFRV